MFGQLKLEDLRTLYIHELEDAYDFEHQILEALPRMEEAARSDQLKQTFRHHRQETENQVQRLEQIFDDLGQDAARRTCKGMKGLLDEGQDYLRAKGNGATLDAALIAAAQRVEHYEMAVYGTLRTYAQALGHTQQSGLLQQSLEEESRADEQLTDLAESGINLEASAAAR